MCRLPVNPGLSRHAGALIKPLLHSTEPVGRSLCPKQHQPPAAPSEWCCGGDGWGETTPLAHAAANGARSSLAPLFATAAIPPATYHVSIRTKTAGQGRQADRIDQDTCPTTPGVSGPVIYSFFISIFWSADATTSGSTPPAHTVCPERGSPPQ